MISFDFLKNREFWEIAGSIGTMVGSLMTGVAVIVAVKQYMQPITKRIEVKFGTKIVIMSVGRSRSSYVYVQVNNRGLMPITISSISLHARNGKNFWLNNMQYALDGNGMLPKTIDKGDTYTFYIDEERFQSEMQRVVEIKAAKTSTRVKLGVADSLGDVHFCNKKFRFKNFFE